MRHVGEIRTGKNVQQVSPEVPILTSDQTTHTFRREQVVLRALQFAKSEPQGPVYLWAMREITEEPMEEKDVPDVRASEVWSAVEPSPLNKSSKFEVHHS